MAYPLYELLGIPKDATTEQIRRAYRKKALKTHPDKLPQDLSEEERNVAAEKFREISHACEILTDPEKRREYDIHGVWPPPEPEEVFETPFRNGWHPRSHAYTPHEYHHSYHNHVFRDPFDLFKTMFEDFDDMLEASPFRPHFAPFDPFGNFGFQSQPGFPDFRGGRSNSHSETFSTRTVNGVTETIHTVRGQDGIEHVTRQYPDGREIYTINGVEQPSSRGDHLVRDTTSPRLLTPGQSRPRRSEAPVYSHPQAPQSRRDARHSNSRDSSYSRNYPAQAAPPSSRKREYDISPPPYTGTNYPHGSYDRYDLPRHSRDRPAAYTGHPGSPHVYDEHHYPRTRSSKRR
ncbi:hypothetical protein Agabi119p4_6915 [Agaricus bisporus var. burnettii]|uniref:J domain-containing protein n=1 Tax=Agaricus bisporus var. burnettii TaxID=192524 RepID=A0A8H7KAR5_AGABI|nr:hypothetical protein Agabi119p4_6915 [Agaricus bisporus var. burnettii]